MSGQAGICDATCRVGAFGICRACGLTRDEALAWHRLAAPERAALARRAQTRLAIADRLPPTAREARRREGVVMG